ncbi:MAG: response regulator [Nitrospira sp.]|nr:response regulator [Nitrospira sp.]
MTTQRQAGPGDTWRRTPRVLIIDDDAGYRALLADMFADWQWDVFEASSGREALDTLERHAINLVLLDAASQGMACADVLAAIRVRPHDLRIIVMGTVMTEKLRIDWRSRGAMDCLVKPIEPRTLSALLVAFAPPSGFADS